MIDLAKLRTWDDPGETICADAAAEIERLRKALAEIRSLIWVALDDEQSAR